MQPVPGYDLVKAAGDTITDYQLNWIVFVIYLTTLCFVI